MGIKNWLKDKMFWLRAGVEMKTINDGNPIEEKIIKMDNIYISMFVDATSGEPTGDFAWSDSAMTFHVPIRDFYTARRER